MNTQGQRRFRNILLAGLPGVGKSTFGKAYAQMSRTEFVELDKYVERLAGKSISDIFAQDGEAAFRALEAQCLERLLRRQRCTIALGGGTLTHPQSLALARELGCIVLLTAPLDDVVERLWPQKDSRPLMSGCATKEQLKQRLHELLIQREESYAAADVVLDTTHSSVDTLKIELSWLERHLLNRAKPSDSEEQQDRQPADRPLRRIPLADPAYRSPREQRSSRDMVEKMERLIKSQSQRGKERGDKKERSDKRDRTERREKSPNQAQNQQQVQAQGQNPRGGQRQRPRPQDGATQGPVPARQAEGTTQGPVPARQAEGATQGPVPARRAEGVGGAGPVPRQQNSNPRAQLPTPKPQRNSAANDSPAGRRPEKPDPAPRD